MHRVADAISRWAVPDAEAAAGAAEEQVIVLIAVKASAPA